MLYCSFEIVKAMFLQKGKFMILECEKMHFVAFCTNNIMNGFILVVFSGFKFISGEACL